MMKQVEYASVDTMFASHVKYLPYIIFVPRVPYRIVQGISGALKCFALTNQYVIRCYNLTELKN